MSTELAPGVVIAGRYQLDRALGQGGMGVVWAAVHTVTRKRVALKFLRGPVHMRPELRRRFLREARAASAVVHPNVLEVHDVFELDDQTPVMLMDLLQGETLGQRISRKGALSVEETAEILVQVVSAVGTAHGVGVVHRDLKPDNIFLVPMTGNAASVRVLDFGIAKLVGSEGAAMETGIITGTGAMLGTPCYMSPEQSFGEKQIDYRTDIWALGAILYECLTGARPIEGDSIGQVVKRLVSEGITPISVLMPSLPGDLSNLVDRMLVRERDHRLSDLHEVQEILYRYTATRAQDFGAVGSAPVEPTPDAAQRVVIDSDSADPSASTHQVPSGPETAAAHTLSSPGATARPRRTWAVAALALVIPGAGVVFWRATAHETAPTSPAAPSITTTSVVPSPAPAVPAVTAATGAPEPAPGPVQAAEPPRAEPGARTPSKTAPKRAAAPAPAPSAAPAPQPAAPAAPAKPRLGGLAEKPPF